MFFGIWGFLLLCVDYSYFKFVVILNRFLCILVAGAFKCYVLIIAVLNYCGFKLECFAFG